MPFDLIVMTALLVKHYFADFVLQPPWMLSAKGKLAAPGGYAHAGVHAAGSGIVLLVCGVGPTVIAAVMAAEFVVHFAIDFAKDFVTARTNADRSPKTYWRLHGLDQFAHQLTYVAITWAAVASIAS